MVGEPMRSVEVIASVENAVRNVQHPISLAMLSQSGKLVDDALTMKAMVATNWDDWELAGEDELFLQSPQPMPRLVFSDVPSFDEAKEATNELKHALDKWYLSSPNATAPDGSFAGYYDSAISVSTASLSDTESCVLETGVAPSVPQHALQAFRLLSTSPEAQIVVASIASDPKVWKALLDSPALKYFLLSPSTSSGSRAKEWNENCEECSSCGSTSNDPGKANGFRGMFEFMESIRVSVVDLACNVSNFLQKIFSFAAATDSDGESSKSNFIGSVYLLASFMGLAVLVAMVVLLKRVGNTKKVFDKQ